MEDRKRTELEGGEDMRHISSLLQGLARSLSVGKERKGSGDDGEAAATAVLRTSGTLWGEGSETFAAVCSRRGEKGINQDCAIVCEGFGCEERSVLCGIFDGHGQWGHYVAKAVRESLPPALLRRWREAVTLASLIDGGEKRLCECQVDLWRQSYHAACAAVDDELRASRRLDAIHSGCTALCLVKHGDLLVIANVGDSRAVLATASPDNEERERIMECNGRVQCLADEPGVHRVWRPDREGPGLAMSRAFGDYCVKDYGVISAPEVTHRRITAQDHFVILATDGVWDVVSNEEAVQIVASAPEREKAAKRLVEFAVRAWRRKRRGIAVDDCSAICLFFHSPPS
uniref:protein-serine/threonine phosphatase n=2 Tax=Oryza punctata TaxID=4537 RepID=A0A0E0L1H6_ORYPU